MGQLRLRSWTTLSWVDDNLWRRVVPKSGTTTSAITGGQTLLTFTRADVGYLSGEAGATALAGGGAFRLSDASLVTDVAAIRDRFGDHAAVLVQTTLLRRKAVAKFGAEAGGWLFTDEALQQATTAAVAGHRARRLAGRVVRTRPARSGPAGRSGRHRRLPAGSDIDEVRLAMARHNLSDRIPLCRADALHPVTGALDVVVLLDPARRSGAGGGSTRAPTPHRWTRWPRCTRGRATVGQVRRESTSTPCGGWASTSRSK